MIKALHMQIKLAFSKIKTFSSGFHLQLVKEGEMCPMKLTELQVK